MLVNCSVDFDCPVGMTKKEVNYVKLPSDRKMIVTKGLVQFFKQENSSGQFLEDYLVKTVSMEGKMYNVLDKYKI